MTMTNAEWMINNGYKFDDLWVISDDITDDSYDYLITFKSKPICKYKATTELTWCQIILKWLDMEHKEPILDDVEKKYLSAVIKPFRNKIYTIVKWRSNSGDSEWLSFIGKVKFCTFYLPNFKAGTMYKGMEVGRRYTLEELGL